MDTAIDKSARSCFVGNIPYEATEEKLKEIFSSVGPVISFKLVYDRENGKPRGYGFCEFMDPETAMSAMRNLNGYEINGRPLRVDSASTERSEINFPGLQGGVPGVAPAGPVQEQSPYGDPVDPEKAPEAISKAVASLPPEQMFELMKQMKDCINNNPQEARDMLLKNPQLAYALLQALVVMRIVDPEMALNMLHKQTPKSMPVGIPPSHHQAVPPPPMSERFREHFAPQGDMERRGDQRMNDDRFSRDSRDRFSEPPRDRDPRQAHRDPRAERDPRSSRRHMESPGEDFPSRGVPPQLAAADPEKADLIRQVLQLSDVQIAALPIEQQASIRDLKSQLGNVPR